MKKVLYVFILFFICLFQTSCVSNKNYLVVRADTISLYETKSFVVNDYNDQILKDLSEHSEIKKYDENYFKEKAIIVILTKADSSRINYSVTTTSLIGELFLVNLEAKSKEYVTMDLVSQYIIIEISKEESLKINEIKVEYKRIIEK